jgi:hypothetical protein
MGSIARGLKKEKNPHLGLAQGSPPIFQLPTTLRSDGRIEDRIEGKIEGQIEGWIEGQIEGRIMFLSRCKKMRNINKSYLLN